MKWNGIFIMVAIIGWWSLSFYHQNKHAYYKGMYERLNADVQAVFGNERPSEESLANVQNVVDLAFEKDRDRRKLEEEVITLKHQLEYLTADQKKVMSRLLDAQQANRILQTEINILREKLRSNLN